MSQPDHRRWRLHAGSLLAVLALLVTACGESGDAGGEDPGANGDASANGNELTDLEGETLQMAVHMPAGGGWDWYGRLMAGEFEDRLGVTAVVDNETGAGGAISYTLTHNTPADALRVATVSMPAIIAIPLAEEVPYDPSPWQWIGRLAADDQCVVTHSGSGFETFDDLLAADRPLKGASTGPGTQSHGHMGLLDLLWEDIEIEFVFGFEGSPDSITALMRQEVDLFATSCTGMVSSIEDGDLHPVVVMGSEPSDLVPGTRTILEFEPDDPEDGRRALESYLNLYELRRLLAVPPSMPAERVELLRRTFDEIMNDPEVIARAEEEGRDLQYMSGEDVQAAMDAIADAGPVFDQVMQDLFGPDED